MSARSRLKDALKAAAQSRESGDFQAAREILARVKADPAIGELGQMTSLGQPRQWVSAQLKLAKAERDAVRRIGYQYHLTPETSLLEPFTRFSSDERRELCRAQAEPVPRCIHQIWIGDQAPPAGTAAWRVHAQQHGHEYILWREDDLRRIGLEELPLYRQLVARGNLPGAVDVARYFILQQQGGIYLDCDWYPARTDLSFHDLLPMTGLAALAEEIPRNTGKGGLLLSNALLLAPPGHPVFTRLLAVMEEVVETLPGAPVWWTTGPLIFTLVARSGPLALADAGLVAGSLPQQTALHEVRRWCRESQLNDSGLLLAWKSWVWSLD